MSFAVHESKVHDAECVCGWVQEFPDGYHSIAAAKSHLRGHDGPAQVRVRSVKITEYSKEQS